ncbi:hypothetical protein K438DRAFT_1880331 [Mycena galopus ATCC 62051]|nr:hypothetical protein K438DRAFT_1880331 [Mycena galopus ATCC 62051]
MGNSPYIPCEVLLPPKQLEKLVSSAGTFLKHALVEPKHILKAVAWDMAAASDVSEVCDDIARWRLTLESVRTPQSARRARKQPRPFPVPPTPQPVFTPLPAPRLNPPTARTNGNRHRGRRGAAPVSSRQMASTPSTPLPARNPVHYSFPTPVYDHFFNSIPGTRTFIPTPLRVPLPSVNFTSSPSQFTVPFTSSPLPPATPGPSQL